MSLNEDVGVSFMQKENEQLLLDLHLHPMSTQKKMSEAKRKGAKKAARD